jgi:galactokinase
VTRPHPAHVMQGLLTHGLSERHAMARASDLLRCDDALSAHGAAASGRATVWAPGRIEVFGKHTDYAGGRSLLVATERGMVLRVAPRADRMVRVLDLAGNVQCELPLSSESNAPDGHWSNYIATVARRLARDFPEMTSGADIALHSDLPVAAGASSSTSLMIGVALCLTRVNALAIAERFDDLFLMSPTALPTYLGAIEMGGAYGPLSDDAGVGTFGGCQDQTAILCAARDKIIDADWLPTRLRGEYALPESLTFVVGASGVAAEKSAGARARYNRVSLMVRHLLDRWNTVAVRADISLGATLLSSLDAADQLRSVAAAAGTTDFSATELVNRLEQFVLETQSLIPAATAAMESGRWADLGDLAQRSHDAADQWLGNQIAETNALVQFARQHGALAASAFGAGFGGSVWALVDQRGAELFQQAWATAYRSQFPHVAQQAIFFQTRPGTRAGSWREFSDTI